MNQTEPGPEEVRPAEAVKERIETEAARLRGEAKERAAAANGVASLGKARTLDDPVRLLAALEKLERTLPAETGTTAGLEPLFAEVRAYARGAEERIRKRLGRELKEACEAAGLPFRVVSREEPVEVRIAPLLLRIDFRRARADLLFAREVVATTRPDAAAIVAAHERARRALQSGFDPDRFFEDSLSAYRAALALGGRTFGDRVELLEFLPLLAVLKQPKRFRASPARESFRSYPKARFAYDVLALSRAGGLIRRGLRLNLGVATGTTATQKDRVVYLEDEEGNGEYKLTVFFTPVEER